MQGRLWPPRRAAARYGSLRRSVLSSARRSLARSLPLSRHHSQTRGALTSTAHISHTRLRARHTPPTHARGTRYTFVTACLYATRGILLHLCDAARLGGQPLHTHTHSLTHSHRHCTHTRTMAWLTEQTGSLLQKKERQAAPRHKKGSLECTNFTKRCALSRLLLLLAHSQPPPPPPSPSLSAPPLTEGISSAETK